MEGRDFIRAIGGDYTGIIRKAGSGDPRSIKLLRALVKIWLAPYITGFLEGFGGEKNVKKVVESKVSFWSQLLPPELKEKAKDFLKKHKGLLELSSDRGCLSVVISALADDLPWLPKTVPPWYVESELEKIRKEL